MPRQINILSNDIFNPKTSINGFKKEKNLLKNKSQKHQ